MAIAGVEVRGRMLPGHESILTDEALAFLADLHRLYEPTRRSLLRGERRRWLDAGNKLDFPAEMRSVRMGGWKISGTPADVQDRRVEITGPVDRKMVTTR